MRKNIEDGSYVNLEDANPNMPHSTLTTNSLLQKQARQKRRIILLQKRANTCQGTHIFRTSSDDVLRVAFTSP